MVRSFSNPLLMIRPFCAGGRKRSSSKDKGVATEKEKGNVQTDRKFSIDHTVLSSGDDSRQNASQDFSTSFDADASSVVKVFPPTFAQGLAAVEDVHNDADFDEKYMKASKSLPSFLTHHPDESGIFPCEDCSLALTQQQLSSSVGSYPPRYGRVRAAAAAPPTNLQYSASPKSRDDPALRARTEAIGIQQQLLGENHPDVIFALSSLAKLYQRHGNHAEAATILSEAQMRSSMAKSAPHLSSKSRQNLQQDPNVPNEICFPHEE